MADSNNLEPWQWPEDTWRTIVSRVRAGRSLTPAIWPNGARVAVALSFDSDHEAIPLRDDRRSPGVLSQGEYGAHWWLAMDGSGIFNASGYRGQYIVVDPRRDLVLVRLGGSTPEQRVNVVDALAEVTRSFPG